MQRNTDADPMRDLLEYAAISEWPDEIEALSVEDVIALERQLVAHIERAARLYGYLDGRECALAHTQAVKKSNTLARKVRKLLGYQITHDITF